MLGSDSVSVDEVAAVVKRLLERYGVFPPNAKPWQPGEIVFEGFFLCFVFATALWRILVAMGAHCYRELQSKLS
jgi:hypothetical protein